MIKRLAGLIANGILARFGYEVKRRPRWTGRLTKRSSLELLKGLGVCPETVVDVGVGPYGTPELYEVFPDSMHVLVEPVKEFWPAIEALRAGIKRSRLVRAAAFSQEGTATLRGARGLTHFTLGETTGERWESSLARETPMTTLDQICKTHQTQGPYLIKVDVDGKDLDVLQGSENVLKETACVVIESNPADISAKASFLEKRGFFLWDIVDLGYKERILHQVDLILIHNQYRSEKFVTSLMSEGVLFGPLYPFTG